MASRQQEGDGTGGGGNRPRRERASRREFVSSSSSRYRVEIPTTLEDYGNAARKSPRRTRSDLPRRHSTKGREDVKLSSDSVVQVEQSSSSSKVADGTGVDSKRNDEQDRSLKPSVKQSERVSGRESKNREPSQHRPSSRASHAVKQELGETGSDRNTSFSSNSSSYNGLNSSSEHNKAAPPSASNVVKTSSSKKAKARHVDNDEPLVPKRHFVWMPFGHGRTWSAIVLMVAGIILAIFAKRSTSFVALEKPLVLTPHFAPITNVGLVRMDFCFLDESDRESVDIPYTNTLVDDTDKTSATGRSSPVGHCSTVRLSSDIVEDTMWQVSRIAASLSIALGTFFCIMLICTLYWESINLKPMAVGLLITYLLQSFSFFFYDSELCRDHGCKLALGTYLSILASFCWFGASMMCIVMDVYHARKMKRLARLERRRRRRLRRAEKLARKCSTGTAQTERSEASEEGDIGVVDEGVELKGDWTV